MDPWVLPSMGWTPARSHHGCSNQCLLLGTHGCILFHWKDTNMDPWVHLAMGWTAAWTLRCSTLCSALGTHGCTLFHWKDAAWTHGCSTLCSARGTHGCTFFYGKNTRVNPWVLPLPLEGHSMEPPLTLHPTFGPKDPRAHSPPLEGHQHAPIGAAPHAQPLGPTGAPSSIGRTPAWTHCWFSTPRLALGTHGCTHPRASHAHGPTDAPHRRDLGVLVPTQHPAEPHLVLDGPGAVVQVVAISQHIQHLPVPQQSDVVPRFGLGGREGAELPLRGTGRV